MKQNDKSYTLLKIGNKCLIQIVLIILAILFLFPTIWMLCASFYDATQAAQYPPKLLPDPFSIRSYEYVFSDDKILGYFINTILVTVLCIIGTLVTSSLTAFGFAKLKSRCKNFLFFIVLSTMMIPATVTLIPMYTIYSKLGFVNTYLPLVIPSFCGGGAFSIFLLRQFFAAIPKDLSESATIDGCNWLGIFMKIVLPNAKPALIVVMINQFVFSWNDYFAPMIYLQDPKKYTLSIGISFFKDMYGSLIDVGPMMAVSMLAIIPILIVYIICQKYFIEGVVTTGIKG